MATKDYSHPFSHTVANKFTLPKRTYYGGSSFSLKYRKEFSKDKTNDAAPDKDRLKVTSAKGQKIDDDFEQVDNDEMISNVIGDVVVDDAAVDKEAANTDNVDKNIMPSRKERET